MSKQLAGLLGKEQWKRCQELLRPPPPPEPTLPAIRAYVKSVDRDDDGDDVCPKSQGFLVRTSRPVSKSSTATQWSQQRTDVNSCIPIDTALAGGENGGENDLWTWVREFVGTQDGDLKPWIVQDRSRRYAYAEVSIKGARHENQDTLFR